MKPKIMFVNDSIKVLESLKRFFNDSTYHFFGCEDPFEALDKMKEAEFAVVVAGQSMSKIGVIEFFKKAKQLSPNIVGIVMTPCFELDNAYVLSQLIYHYCSLNIYNNKTIGMGVLSCPLKMR